jgi:hypothetical protein
MVSDYFAFKARIEEQKDGLINQIIQQQQSFQVREHDSPKPSFRMSIPVLLTQHYCAINILTINPLCFLKQAVLKKLEDNMETYIKKVEGQSNSTIEKISQLDRRRSPRMK